MLLEDLGEWFGTGPKGSSSGGGWDRYSTTGKKLGKCGDRKPGEGKPKCLSKKAAARLRAKGGAKEIGKAVKRKKRKDPNPERTGAPKNVNTESLLQQYVLFIENVILEKNEPTNPKLWSSAKAAASRKYKIKNSAYKNGYAVQWYNKRGGGWRTVSESSINQPMVIGYGRKPAYITIKFPSGETYDYMLREEHDLDYYINTYRTKLKRNAGLLASLLKKHQTPFEKRSVKENHLRSGHLLNEIAGSFDDNFPTAKKIPLRSKTPQSVPPMHADERRDTERKDSEDKEGEYPNGVYITSESNNVVDVETNLVIMRLTKLGKQYRYIDDILSELENSLDVPYIYMGKEGNTLYFMADV